MPNTSAARSPIDVGTVIAGTYTIEALVGRGGMGAVFLASHNRLPGKKVAIKVLHAELAEDDVLARFRREADIAAQLDHPNIVGVVDYNALPDGTPYLVMEYLQGETLAQRLRRGPLTVEHAMSVVRQIGSALAAAHRAGIVHRDLKPQNIFLVPTEIDGRRVELAKVLDFGISKIRGSQTVKTQESALLGTPQYMAPEQATGQHASVDERTDVFALGAIVYEMLSGHPAFSGASIPEVVFKVVYEEPAPLATEAPDLPSTIVEAVATAMKKPATDRFATVNGFVEALTGQPLTSDVPLPALRQTVDVAAPTGGSRRLDKEAFAQTMGSGDYGGPVRTDGETLSMPGVAPPSPRNEPFVSTIKSGEQPNMTIRGQVAPDSVVPRRSRRVVFVGGVLAVVASLVLLLSFENRDNSPSATHESHSRHAQSSTKAAAPPADISAGGAPVMEAGSAQPVVEAAKPPPVETAQRADDEPAKLPEPVKPPVVGHTPQPTGIVTANSKGSGPARRGPAPGTGSGSTNQEPDPAVQDQLAQAEQELATGNVDMAWRLANTIINTGHGAARTQAIGIHGVIECTRHNSAEGAGIDLRRLGGGGPARERILAACHARDMLVEEH